jgi:hypothetical protein
MGADSGRRIGRSQVRRRMGRSRVLPERSWVRARGWVGSIHQYGPRHARRLGSRGSLSRIYPRRPQSGLERRASCAFTRLSHVEVAGSTSRVLSGSRSGTSDSTRPGCGHGSSCKNSRTCMGPAVDHGGLHEPAPDFAAKRVPRRPRQPLGGEQDAPLSRQGFLELWGPEGDASQCRTSPVRCRRFESGAHRRRVRSRHDSQVTAATRLLALRIAEPSMPRSRLRT